MKGHVSNPHGVARSDVNILDDSNARIAAAGEMEGTKYMILSSRLMSELSVRCADGYTRMSTDLLNAQYEAVNGHPLDLTRATKDLKTQVEHIRVWMRLKPHVSTQGAVMLSQRHLYTGAQIIDQLRLLIPPRGATLKQQYLHKKVLDDAPLSPAELAEQIADRTQNAGARCNILPGEDHAEVLMCEAAAQAMRPWEHVSAMLDAQTIAVAFSFIQLPMPMQGDLHDVPAEEGDDFLVTGLGKHRYEMMTVRIDAPRLANGRYVVRFTEACGPAIAGKRVSLKPQNMVPFRRSPLREEMLSDVARRAVYALSLLIDIAEWPEARCRVVDYLAGTPDERDVLPGAPDGTEVLQHMCSYLQILRRAHAYGRFESHWLMGSPGGAFTLADAAAGRAMPDFSRNAGGIGKMIAGTVDLLTRLFSFTRTPSALVTSSIVALSLRSSEYSLTDVPGGFIYHSVLETNLIRGEPAHTHKIYPSRKTHDANLTRLLKAAEAVVADAPIAPELRAITTMFKYDIACDTARIGKGNDKAVLGIGPCAMCIQCGKVTRAAQGCGRCKAAFFCDAKCQKLAWPTHKARCSVPTGPTVTAAGVRGGGGGKSASSSAKARKTKKKKGKKKKKKRT